MQLVSQQQQLHQLLVQTYVSNISSSFQILRVVFDARYRADACRELALRYSL